MVAHEAIVKNARGIGWQWSVIRLVCGATAVRKTAYGDSQQRSHPSRALTSPHALTLRPPEYQDVEMIVVALEKRELIDGTTVDS
jgi:hypothetical protein